MTLKVTLTFGVKGKVNAYSFYIVWFVDSYLCKFWIKSLQISNCCCWKKELLVEAVLRHHIFRLEYLRYLLSVWELILVKAEWRWLLFRKKTLFYVTSGLAYMTSLNFQLRISLLFLVRLHHNLVREIWVVHMTLRSNKISCDLEGHFDIWVQWKG